MLRTKTLITTSLWLMSFLLLTVPQSQAQQPSFSKVNIDASFLGRTAIGDIDGDGKNDVVVHRWGTARGGTANGELRWYKYPNWTSTIIKKDPNFFGDAIVAMDIDGNGKTDVVVGKQRDGTSEVWVYLQQANNQWNEKKISDLEVDSGPGSEIKDIEIHDMDGDEKPDFVVRTHSKVAVFFQNTNLTWDNKIITSETHEGMAVGNVGGSTKPDIVLNGFWYENDGSRNLVNWKKYNFDTSWVESSGKGYPLNSVTVRIAKMNNDASNDIVVCHSEKENMPLNWYQAVNPTQGVGGWIKHKVGMVDYCHSMDAYDFDTDGDTDIMMVELPRKTDSSAYLFINNGSQVFSKSKIVDGGGYKASVGDIDNDGDFDIVSSKAWNTGVGHWDDGIVGSPLYLIRNNSQETSPPSDNQISLKNWKRYEVDSNKPWRTVLIDATDLDGDGYKDVVTGGWWYKNPKTPGGAWQRKNIGTPLNNIAVLFDVDGNGSVDIVGTKGDTNLNNSNMVWAANNGSGNFTVHQNIPGGQGDFLQGAVAGNLKSKQIALSWHANGGGIQLLTVPTNPTTQQWTRTFASTTTQDEDLSLGDINLDGRNDLLLGTKWLKNTDNGWSTHALSSTTGDPDRNVLADINSDGRLDAVVGFEAINKSGKLAWYEQPATATDTWVEHIVSSNVIGPMSLDAADMDYDGDIDIVVGEHNYQNSATAKLLVFENISKGVGWSEPYVVHTGDEHHSGAQLVDIDNDSDLDIISIGWQSNKVTLYENTSKPSEGTPPPTNPPAGFDFNNDGKVNILDFTLFVANKLQTIAKFDTDGNGGVDIFDFSKLVAKLHSQSTPLTTPTLPPTNPDAKELKIIDKEVQFTSADNGFHVLKAQATNIPGIPINWKSPDNYYEGEWHFRYTIIGQDETPTAGSLQTCIWHMPGHKPENCAGNINHDGKIGTTKTLITSPKDWWKLNNTPLDFTNSTPFLIRAVLRGDKNNCNVTSHCVDKPCEPTGEVCANGKKKGNYSLAFSKYNNMKFRLTIVMVPQGKTFSGWQNYP